MASPDTITPVEAALAKIGVTLLDEDKAKLEGIAEHLADADAKTLMDALADHLTLHGLAGAMQQPLRNAITGAEPQAEQMINANITWGVDAVEDWLRVVASKAGAAP